MKTCTQNVNNPPQLSGNLPRLQKFFSKKVHIAFLFTHLGMTVCSQRERDNLPHMNTKFCELLTAVFSQWSAERCDNFKVPAQYTIQFRLFERFI